jgi:nicotinamidase-related amidase
MTSRLLRAEDCVLIVVDVQPGFLERVESSRIDGLVERIAFLVTSARFAGVPVVATVERPEDWGPVDETVAAALGDAPVVGKETFGAGDDRAVLEVIAATGRTTAVLTGLETDVCVAHSALSLLDRGFTVACVGDCVASPGSAHDYGLERMRRADVTMLCAKQLHYEWLRTVERSRAFGVSHPALTEPPGVTL